VDLVNNDGEPTIESVYYRKHSELENVTRRKVRTNLQDYLHTIWELNFSYPGGTALSNAPFLTKKQILAKHALKLNTDYFSQRY